MKGSESGCAFGRALVMVFALMGTGCQVVQPVAETGKRVVKGVGDGLARTGEKIAEGFKATFDPNKSSAQMAVPASATARTSSVRLASKDRREVGPTTQPVTRGCADFARVQAEQKNGEWCWAACAQMIYKYHGIDVKQEDIANRIRGQESVQTAGEYEIMRALSETDELWADKFANLHRGGQITFDPFSIVKANVGVVTKNNKYLLVQQLLRGEPCIAGVIVGENFGHAVVVFDVTYTATPNALGKLNAQAGAAHSRRVAGAREDDGGGSTNVLGLSFHPVDVEIVSAKIFDPWPGKGVRELRGDELSDEKLKFVISRESVRQYNEEMENTIKVKPNGRTAAAR